MGEGETMHIHELRNNHCSSVESHRSSQHIINICHQTYRQCR